MIMHFLGGFWLGLILFWVFSIQEVSLKLIFKMILCVLLVSISWEIFEMIVGRIIIQNSLNTMLDSISDIYFDLAGGTLAIVYFLKRIMLKQKSAI